MPLTRQHATPLEVPKILVRAGSEYEKTGVAGIHQHPSPRPTLETLYSHTLEFLKSDFPAHSVYRQAVEGLTAERLKVVQENEVVAVIEEKIGCGLIEEVIIQAHEELTLAQRLAKDKVWEDLEEKPLDDQWVYFGKRV